MTTTKKNETISWADLHDAHVEAYYDDRGRQLREIAESNFHAAIDQAYDYEDIHAAFASYEENTIDTALEEGFDAEDAWSAAYHFNTLVDKHNAS
jgi:hypothetical protein